ncbi:hypothetical protein ACF3N0_10185 (plasmid) [Moraxella atlantae]|uniref:hypothetical protein n=1 Tax=Faucicola atlantae TaxID=34059 RepID=UPI0037514014
MSENRIYLVPVDRDFKPTQAQHEKAVELWQKLCPTYDAIITEKTDKNYGCVINLDEEGYVETKYGLVAHEPHILYEYLDLDDSFFESEEYADYLAEKEEEGEDFDFEDPTAFGENLNAETLLKFEEILGTPVEVLWERI